MKRENSPFCELSVEHQKGQMWDLGIGFDLQTDALMWWESEGGIYPLDPGPLGSSRDHKTDLGTWRWFWGFKLFLVRSMVKFDVKGLPFRMRPSAQPSVTKSDLPARALFRITKGPGSAPLRGIRPQITEDCMSLPGTRTVDPRRPPLRWFREPESHQC